MWQELVAPHFIMLPVVEMLSVVKYVLLVQILFKCLNGFLNSTLSELFRCSFLLLEEPALLHRMLAGAILDFLYMPTQHYDLLKYVIHFCYADGPH
jgi:hypothetical protein